MSKDFVGKSWSFPPLFVKQGDVAAVEMVSGDEVVAQSLRVLLTTDLGERLMHPSFGTGLRHALFQNIDQKLENEIRGYIQDTVLMNEPRARIEDITFDQDAAEACVYVRITYIVKETNNRFNMVFPYYLNEATAVAV